MYLVSKLGSDAFFATVWLKKGSAEYLTKLTVTPIILLCVFRPIKEGFLFIGTAFLAQKYKEMCFFKTKIRGRCRNQGNGRYSIKVL